MVYVAWQRRYRWRMADRLRVAHCSDIHLSGGPEDPARAAFARALAAMRRRGPDLLLLAGDLFDANSVPEDAAEWAMDVLARLPFPVAMIPGNHDCMAQDGIFRRFDFGAIPNVSMLADEPGSFVEPPGLGASVWGRGMASHSPGFLPLAGVPARSPSSRWHLGMGHGFFVPRGEEAGRSSPIRMEEIEASGLDYLALGHHHAAMELVGPGFCAAYSGSPTDDLGRGATYAMVDLCSGLPPSLAIHLVD